MKPINLFTKLICCLFFTVFSSTLFAQTFTTDVDIAGDITIGKLNESGKIFIRRGLDNNINGIVGFLGGGTEAKNLSIQSTSGSGYITFRTNYGGISERLRIANNGYVGIGETTPDFPLQIRTPLEATSPISYGLDLTRMNQDGRGLSFGMSTDNTYSVIGAHNADLKLGHTWGTGQSGQPIFYPDITIKHSDQSTGSVGIGTTNPSQRLEVNGNIALDNYRIISEGGSSIGFGGGGIGNEDDDITIDVANDGELELHRAGVNLLSVGNYILLDRTNTLNVGIGTENPGSKLAVNGQVSATEVKVLSDISVPDYVFEADYDLRTLEETKAFITENKHLPEIPSAKEIEANGINLGDMNMRLLKKIEELTLYQIELLERLEKAEGEISALKSGK